MTEIELGFKATQVSYEDICAELLKAHKLLERVLQDDGTDDCLYREIALYLEEVHASK